MKIDCKKITQYNFIIKFISLYLHEQQPNNEGRPLAVAYFPVVKRIGLHDIEKTFLAESVLLFEKVMLRVCSGDISSDNLKY